MPIVLAILLALMLPMWVSAKQPSKRPTDERRGETLFQQNCWQCHGKRGKGKGPLSAALGGPLKSIAQRYTPEQYDAQVKVIMQGRGDMPSFDQVMDRADARRILVWLEDARLTKRGGKKKKGKAGKRPEKKGKVSERAEAKEEAKPEAGQNAAGGEAGPE